MCFLDLRSITGAKTGADKVRFLVIGSLNPDLGGPIDDGANFLACKCDCIILIPVDQPLATSVRGAPRSSSSYSDILIRVENHRKMQKQINFSLYLSA